MTAGADFWSRRRQAVEEEAAAEEAAIAAEALAQEQSELEQLSEAEILEKLDLPDPQTLQKGDDFSVFMASAVPEVIRRKALRVLWRSNPVLANVDALVDYGEDFTDSAMAVENIQTAYQVGKGMLKHIEELARQAAEPEAEGSPEVEEEALALAETVEQAEPLPPSPNSEVDDDPVLLATPRRMTFQTEESA